MPTPRMQTYRSRSIALGCCGALVLVSAACSTSASSGSAKTGEPRTVKIGVVEPLTGPLAEAGQKQIDALKFGVARVNAEGGIKGLDGAKLELVIEDDQGNPSKAAASVAHLVQQSKVDIVVGAYSSAETIPMAASLERLKVPLIAPGATSDKVTESGFSYVVRIPPKGSQSGASILDFLSSGELEKAGYPKPRRVAMIYEDGAFGSTIADNFKKGAPAKNLKIVADIPFTTGTPSLSAKLSKLASGNPDVIVFGGYSGDGILFTRALANSSLANVPLVDGGGAVPDPSFIDGLGPQADGWFSALSWNQGISAGQDFMDAFTKQYDIPMNGQIAFCYQSILVIRNVLNETKSLDSQKINDALHNLDIPKNDVDNVMPGFGPLKIDPSTGQSVNAKWVVGQVQNSKINLVWPQTTGTVAIQPAG